MNERLRADAEQIVRAAIEAVKPDAAVRRALENIELPEGGKLLLVAAGKAAWQMADAAVKWLAADEGGRGRKLDGGVAVTKYGHVMGEIPGVRCIEAGHPVPDENSFLGAEAVLELCGGLGEGDVVLFLLSGGGSALFEKPLVEPEALQDITKQLLACGADIVEINTIRKRLSAVKGGRFALHCAPARVESVILSDILGDPLDMIASGPAAADPSTCDQALAIVEKYGLRLSAAALELLGQETPKALDNVNTQVIGSVRELCGAAARAARALGYEPLFLTDCMDCEAREAGRFLAAVLRSHAGAGAPAGKGSAGSGGGAGGRRLAFLAGGETVVHLTGTGRGGRNQEIALGAAEGLRGLREAAVISAGSDGTDGPTDAAGGYADGDTAAELEAAGFDIAKVLRGNDAYTALGAAGALIFTGPTGTNVNDITVGLIAG